MKFLILIIILIFIVKIFPESKGNKADTIMSGVVEKALKNSKEKLEEGKRLIKSKK